MKFKLKQMADYNGNNRGPGIPGEILEAIGCESPDYYECEIIEGSTSLIITPKKNPPEPEPETATPASDGS